ncbi:MAG: amidohydrolase family protein [Pseudomonadales bacterium]
MKRSSLILLCVFVAAIGSHTSHAQTIAITNATVHTMTANGVLEDATIIIRDGKIAAVGKHAAIPPRAKKIDATGKIVTPGLFDSYSYLGLVEVSQTEETVDNFQTSKRFSAGFDVADAINPRSTLIPINRIEGITRALVAPTSTDEGSHIAGLGAVIHLGGNEAYIDRRRAALFADIGEFGAALAGGSRAAAILQLREVLQDTQDYIANKLAYEGHGRREYAAKRLDLEALEAVLQGKIPLVLSVDRASDIEAALRLARDFELRLIIAGGAEAWLVAAKIAAQNVPVIIDPTQNLPQRFETLGARLDNAALLHKAGVTIVFATAESHNSRNLKQAAGNAVANGLPHEAALEALTVNPARIYHIADNYGSVAPGKDADIVIWGADPLEVTTFAEQVFIRGRKIPMISRQTLLRDRYLERNEWPVVYKK